MDFDTLRLIENEAERVNALYSIFTEDERLNRSQAARVEFLTTIKYIEQYTAPGCKILDIGAGAGEYSVYLANQGHCVTAVELADDNIKAFKQKLTPELNIDLHQGNALDLSMFDDAAFDVVLLFGPLYHIADAAQRTQCIHEARRVCKPGGIIFIAYISNDMVILTETFKYNAAYLTQGDYDKASFKVKDFPFVFKTVTEARDEVMRHGITLLHAVASDGVSELLDEKINALDAESYQQYLNYHFYCCEKPEMLGRSNHLLFAGRN